MIRKNQFELNRHPVDKGYTMLLFDRLNTCLLSGWDVDNKEDYDKAHKDLEALGVFGLIFDGYCKVTGEM